MKFLNSRIKHNLTYGGQLRKKRSGRGQRPLSTKHSLHLVFKLNQQNLIRRSLRNPKNFKIVNEIFVKFSARFFIKIDQMSIQHNHIHVIVRASRRQNFHSFFRVISGQIAQRLKMVTDTPGVTKTVGKSNASKKLWLQRPFTRVVKAWKSLLILRKYVALNEMEVTGRIHYRKDRLRGVTALWDHR